MQATWIFFFCNYHADEKNKQVYKGHNGLFFNKFYFEWKKFGNF